MKDQKAQSHDLTGTGKTPRRLRRRVAIATFEPTMAKQSFKDECDINLIVRRAEQTGVLPSLIKENPKFGDFSDPISYQDSLNLVIKAEAQFQNLSSHIRERFNNDPKKFLEFTANPANNHEMVTLGLAQKRQTNLNNNETNADQKTTQKNKNKVGEKADDS